MCWLSPKIYLIFFFRSLPKVTILYLSLFNCRNVSIVSGNTGRVMKAMIDPVYAAVMMIENTQYVPENERHELVVLRVFYF